MLLAPIDWIIIAVYMVGCVVAGVWMRRYVRNVEDFAVAGREMDLNLGVASLAATEVGIVTVMYTAENGFKNGLAGATPGLLACIMMLLVGITGFVIVPMRNAGVITIPELFEKRFGKHVRWLAGVVVILGGVLNMGIFLRLGGDFLMFVCGLDPAVKFQVDLPGLTLNLGMLEVMMTGLLAVVLVYTVLGGMLSVLITDYLQFIVMGFGIVITSVLVIWNVGWSNLLAELPEANQIREAYVEAQQATVEARAAAGLPAEEADGASMSAAGQYTAQASLPTFQPGLLLRARIAADLARQAVNESVDGVGAPDQAKTRAAMARLAAEVARRYSEQVDAARTRAARVARQAAPIAREAAEAAQAAEQEAISASKAVADLVTKARVAAAKAEVLQVTADAAARESSEPGATEIVRQANAHWEKAKVEASQLAEKVEEAKNAQQRADTTALEQSLQAIAAAKSASAAAELVKDTTGGLLMAHPFNPIKAFGWGWVTWQAMLSIAIVTTWQTTIARVLSARNASTAKAIYRRTSFYYVGRFGLPGLWGIGAFLYFWQRGELPEGVNSLTAMPAFLHTILGPGLLGLVIAAMLAAEMSTDSGYLLTWATVIYNDIISPCLRKPLSPTAKLLTVRLLVLAIGLFLVLYGLWYELPGAAWDYLAVTGNIYLASLFTLLVAGLYWRGANSWGAVAAIILGAIGPITFLVVNAIVDKAHQISPEIAGWSAFGMAFAGMIVGSYVGRAMGKGQPAAADSSLLTKEQAP